MTRFVYVTLAAAWFAAPYAAMAQQSAQPASGQSTRAQVYAELAALQKVGYSGITACDLQYPDNVQTALKQVSVRSDNAGGVVTPH